MSDSFADALAQAIQNRATEDATGLDKARRARGVRSPDQNNPWRAEAYRAPRQRTYRDPTGGDAAGNVDRERKNR